MKKIILIIVLAAVLMSLFTGCTAKTETAEENVTVQTEEKTEEVQKAGIMSSFQTLDINGNAVGESVLKGKKLTMLNVWATYCGPCIKEMPDIAKLHHEYEDKGFQVIGMPVDIIGSDGMPSEEYLYKALEIAAATGADYTHIFPCEGLLEILSMVQAVPMTLFVDENGTQVGEVYFGAKSYDGWKAVADSLLEGM